MRGLIAPRGPTWTRTGGPGRGRAAAPPGARGRRREGRGWWASHHRRGRPRPPRYGSSAPQAGQWRGGATLARRAIVADAATASRASALTYHPTGENPRKPAKLGRVHTIGRRSQRRTPCPYGLPRPPPSTHPWWSCRSGTAPRCCRCRTAHRQRRAARRDRRSGRRLGGHDAGSPGTSCRARHARRGARGR